MRVTTMYVKAHYIKTYKHILPSSVVEFVLPSQMASLIRGGANAGPWRNDELCPRGIPRRDEEATAPPKARTSSPFGKITKIIKPVIS